MIDAHPYEPFVNMIYSIVIREFNVFRGYSIVSVIAYPILQSVYKSKSISSTINQCTKTNHVLHRWYRTGACVEMSLYSYHVRR